MNPKADAREAPKIFTFDQTYGPGCTQREIYDKTASPIVDSVLEGFNGTIFAYGQTGAGKSFTMEGKQDPPELQGIIPNSFKHIFEEIAVSNDGQRQYLIRASYLEIYNEEIRDLLSKNSKRRLELKESVDSGVYVKDLTSFVVKSVDEIDHVMQAGKKNRSVGSTLMNQTSSRSHSIFTITVETSEPGADGEQHFRVGKLNMVDLAGSERQSKTGATGDRLKEATKINLSLSALGNVISALVDSRTSYIPYRDSKLTRLLQDSLGGNTKTVMIANCGPADYNYDETLSTLRYASRAKNIKNKPKINEDPKDAMLREFQEEIARLRSQLENAGAGGGGGGGGGPGQTRVEKVVVEKVVEKVVEVNRGVDEAKVKELEERAAAEREAIRKKAADEMRQLQAAQSKTEEEKARLAEELRAKTEAQEKASKERSLMQKKLLQLQEKLLVGGKMLDKAQKQEADLKRVQIELQRKEEERKRLEQQHVREMEEANLMIEEQYATMQDEVEAKTKKLKRCWQKLQAAKSEIRDLTEEFQTEKEDLLEALRESQRQLKLKELLLANFVPPREIAKLEARAQWSDRDDKWLLAGIEHAGNRVNPRRPVSAANSRRPESEYARHRAQHTNNPRYKADNVAQLELDMPERTVQNYEGAAMSHRVQEAINAALEGETDDVTLAAPENLPNFPQDNPYMKQGGGHDSGHHRRPRSGARKKRSKRPGTASRKRRAERDREAEMAMTIGDHNEYPQARGLLGHS